MKITFHSKIVGTILLLTALGLASFWYSWKLAIILFLALSGNNIEQKFKN